MRFRDLWGLQRGPGFGSRAEAAGKIVDGPCVVRGPLRYALVGAGSAARVHLNSVLQTPNLAVVGVADPRPEASWRIPKMPAACARFTDISQMLVETRPHLVSICTPPKFHHSLTLSALGAGAHVICEKPMAMTVPQAMEMAEACRKSGLLGAINFGYRNLRCFRYARHLIATRQVGRLMRVSVVYLQSFMATDAVRWSWRHDAEIAGFGALGDLAVHMIDGVRFVTGLEFNRVVALTRTFTPTRSDGDGVARSVTTDTHAMFLAELDRGTMGTFEATQMAPGYGDLFRIEVSGDLGTLCIDSEHSEEIQWSTLPRSGEAIWNSALTRQTVAADFEPGAGRSVPGDVVAAVRGATVDFPTFHDGVASQRVLGAITRSLSSGSWSAVE